MAARGVKPKAAHLRLIDGTHRAARHGDSAKAREQVEKDVAAFGKLVRPKYLKGQALIAWKRYIEPATWLDGSREPIAIGFCELWREFREAPRLFTAAKHAQLRHYLAELGMTDERNRTGGGADESDRDEFFDD